MSARVWRTWSDEGWLLLMRQLLVSDIISAGPLVGFKMTPAAVADYKNEKSNMVNEENEEADDASQNLSRFNDVMDSVMNWSEDN